MPLFQVPSTTPAKPQVRIFRITDIPEVMQHKLGWPMAAQLMRRWFKGAARIIARSKALLLATLLTATAAAFLITGEKLELVSISPDRTYRLEYYTPRRYQRLVNWKMEEPTFVRLYRNIDNAYFGESIVADFFGGTGDAIWLIDKTGEVAIGGFVLYKNVPPVTAGGEVLPVPTMGTS